MQVEEIHLASLSGHCFNTAEKAAIKNSTTLLKDAEKIETGLQLWGKIMGIQKDYIIVEVPREEVLQPKTYFYSVDGGMNWSKLPQASPADVKKAETIYRRFLGDPAFETKPTRVEEDGDSAPISEEKRLAATIEMVNRDAVIVPRGYYYRDAQKKIRLNQFFNGLSKSEAEHLSSYLHLRDTDGKPPVAVGRDRLDDSIDIFDSIEADAPKGAWSVRLEDGGKTALLRSLHWPGYVASHSLATGKFAWVYIGNGLRNHDIGYEL